MIGTVAQNDYIIAVIGFIFSIVLIPTLLNKKSVVPAFSSLLSSAGLYTIAIIFLNLSLWVASLSEFLCATVWIAIFIWRREKSVA